MKKYNLVLDLDATLLNTTITKITTEKEILKCYDYIDLVNYTDFVPQTANNLLHHPNFSFTLPQTNNGVTEYYKYNVYFRPYLFFFLYNLKKHYNLIIYTHGTTTYANVILSYLNNIIDTYYKSSVFVSWFINYKKTKSIFYIVVSRTDNQLPVVKSLDVLPFLDPTFTVIIDDNVSVWDKKYHHILYNIPQYKLSNKYDNILLLLYQDLVEYISTKSTQNLLVLKFVK
jgi:hypothetical protein